MATRKISYFKNNIKKESLRTIREIANNKEKMYAVNAVKAARQILRERKK